MPFTHYLQARIKGRIHGQETVNVLNFGSNVEVQDQEELPILLTNLAVAIIACVVQELLPAVTSDWTFTGVDCKKLNPTPSDPVEVLAEEPNVGLRGSVNTSFEATLIRIRTGGGGKRGRGRNFFPPAGDADITDSTIEALAVQTQLGDFIACVAGKFIGASATENYRLGILSRTHLKLNPGDFDGAFREATQMAVETKVSCLRSRKVGHGS